MLIRILKALRHSIIIFKVKGFMKEKTLQVFIIRKLSPSYTL